MTYKMTAIIIFSLLSGCYQSQNNQEIILANKECEDAGMRSVFITNEFSHGHIQCRPQKEDVNDW